MSRALCHPGHLVAWRSLLSLERHGPGKARPVAAGCAAKLAEARALAELALGAYAAHWRELSAARHSGDD